MGLTVSPPASLVEGVADSRRELIDYIKLRLAVAGSHFDDSYRERLALPHEVIAHLKERIRLSYGQQSPIDARAQAFLDRYLAGVAIDTPVRLPGLGETFILDRPGIAAELSIPEDGDRFDSDIVNSFRLANGQGLLHNPKSDRRTTEGVFHVTEGGLPIPNDKRAVPKEAFARLINAALNPPATLTPLPFTANREAPFRSLVSLMIRPMVVPEVPGITPQKTAEIRFVAPGNLVSNLDFVERIFGNAGDPHLPENDAGLDVEHWTGHTGMVILAPHLINITKASLGLPKWDDATERQKRDGMCWKSADEKYNDGSAFKLTARDEAGIIITLIADNYFGYCKKEVKTQMSFCANLLGGVEEEHAGGALVFPQYDLGKEFSVRTHLPPVSNTFAEVLSLYGKTIDLQPEGYGIDKTLPHLYYVPEDVHIDVNTQTVKWTTPAGEQKLSLSPDRIYMVPSGFKVRLAREEDSGQWRLIGTTAEGTFCHKPSTVSGGGKSEISKPITDAITHAPLFIADFEKDLDAVQTLIDHDYSQRLRNGVVEQSRSILSPKRSLGSVIKLMTQSETLYTDEYNAWLQSIPHSIRELLYVVKRYYRPEMESDWRSHFGVNVVNGRPGNTLKFEGEQLIAHYMRVGFSEEGNWRMFSLRNDYVPAEKIQREDDITSSAVIPTRLLPGTNRKYDGTTSVKIVSAENPERCFFQRPDEAIHRGYDKLTEANFSSGGNFFSNYEPFTATDATGLIDSPIKFAEYTEPMRVVIEKAAKSSGFLVSSAHPRLVGGKPSKNPRYLQRRPDISNKEPAYLAETGVRMHRRIALGKPVPLPVNAVLPGRRLNPPDAAAGIRSLAVYNPIHHQETPELFMELISSLTGKSPSTTGAGSEGALTKGPFNALPPIIDLNAAFVSHVLTGTNAFVTAAGYLGPKYRVDHDVSLLIPEVWSRMEVAERDPKYLIENRFLEPLHDFEWNGKLVHASRLGYRVTDHFVRTFFGIVFDNPNDLFSDEMLRPETQDMESFVDGIDNIVGTQRDIARHYFEDNSIEMACPPLKMLLHIMRDGTFEGKTIHDPKLRALFNAQSVLASDWYAERLAAQQQVDIRLWQKHVEYLRKTLKSPRSVTPERKAGIHDSLRAALATLDQVSSAEHLESLVGYIGATPGL